MNYNFKISREKVLEEQQSQQIYLSLVWSIFKRKWWLLPITISIAVVFAYYYFQVPEGPYMAKSVIRPVSQRAYGGSSSRFVNYPIGFASSSGESEFEIIKGKKVIERVIDKLGITELHRDPAKTDSKNRKTAETKPNIPLPPNERRRLLITEIQSRLDIDWKMFKDNRYTNLIEITARSYSPKEAMDLANATAGSYKEVYDSYKRLAWQDLLDILDAELRRTQIALEETRNRLYNSTNQKELSGVFGDFLGAGMRFAPADYPTDIASIRNQIRTLEVRLQVLRKDYSENEPRVANIKKEIEVLRKSLEQEEAKLKEKYSQQYGLSDLASQVAFNEQLYNTLLKTHQELKAQYIMEKQSPEIIETADEPLYPSKPSRRSNLFIAAMAGFALGVVFVLILEFLDTSMRTAFDVAKQTNMPVIGRIPRLKGIKKKPESDALITYKGQGSSSKIWLRNQYKESFRALQFEAMAALGEENKSNSQGKALMITSSMPEEGKSVIATNLAISIAQTDRKVLIVDSDCRQPKQSKILGIDNKAPNLINVLNQEATIEEACRKSSIDNLYVIPSENGDGQIDPSALLSSPKMQQLIDRLREEFDVILFDTPPTSLASEPAAIGSMVDGVVIVIKAASTKKNDVIRTKESIQYSGGNVLGVALNFTTAEKTNSKYYKRN